ncbi:MAG TPA: hypothetical protein VIH47_01730 [Solirubrobacterales bacterium]
MDSCPLCAGIDFDGQRGAPLSGSPFDQVIRRGPGVVLAPTVGSILPGYLMAISADHLLSFGMLGSERLREEIEPWLAERLAELSPVFGEYVVFEHGSAGEDDRQGGCVAHAHMHLVPAGPDLARGILDGEEWQSVGAFSDIAAFAEAGYAYLGAAGRSWVLPEPGFPGQWVRRRIASWAGRPDEWDWGVFRGEPQLAETFERLGAGGLLEG